MEMSILPPCRICGEKASGLHYGVNTCEACKAFFRRSLDKFETFICNRNKTCELPPGRRNFCPYCRFKKCVMLGMCREAIKTGRYTYEKKASDTMELKGFYEWSAPGDEQPDMLQERLLKIQKEHQLITEQPELNKYRKHPKEKMQKQRQNCMWAGRTDDPSPSQISVMNAMFSSASSITSTMSEVSSISNSLDIAPSPIPSSSSSSVSSCAHDSVMNDTDIIEKTINRIYVTFKACSTYTEEFLRNLPVLEDEYIRQNEAKMELFGSMMTVSREEYMSVYESTGIDIDGRRELLQEALPHIEADLKRTICFFKEIPGFSDLTVHDQIYLVKGTRGYCWMLMNRHSFNPSLHVRASVSGKVIGLEDLKKFYTMDLIQAVYDVQRKIHNLNLSDEEACTFAAFCVMTEDRHLVQNIEVAEKNQELLLNCLLYLFKKYHPDDKLRLTKFIDCLLFMCAQRDIMTVAEDTLFQEWDSVIGFPKFIQELWTA